MKLYVLISSNGVRFIDNKHQLEHLLENPHDWYIDRFLNFEDFMQNRIPYKWENGDAVLFKVEFQGVHKDENAKRWRLTNAIKTDF